MTRALNRLTKVVWEDLHAVGIPTAVSTDTMEFDWDKGERRPKETSFDLVRDYPDRYPDSRGAGAERLLFRTLEEAIGYYETLRDDRIRDLYNPLNWIAAILRMPVYVLEQAHLIERGSKSYPWIAKPVMLLMFYVVVKALSKWLGLSIDLAGILAALRP